MPQTPSKKIKPTMEYSTFLCWICLFLSSSYCMLALLSTKKKKKKHNPPLPPGPTPLPIVGNLNLLRGRDDPHRRLAELAADYGPLMTLRFGRVTTIVISSPELAREALHKNDGGLSGRFVFDVLRAAGHHTASVVWRQPDPKWHRLRALYNKHLFSSRSLEASQGVRRKKMEELRVALDDAGRDRRAVGVRRLAQGTLNNVISNLEFSVDMVRLGSETATEFQTLCRELNIEASKPNAADFFPVLRLVDPQGRRRRSAELLRKVHAIFDVMIEERRRGREKKKDLLEVLLEQEKEEEGEDDGDYNLQMNSLFVELFVAGTDTTSSTLEWAMTELLRCPTAMDRVRAELMDVVGPGREVEEDDLPHLPYLRAVLKETLRLHPPGPLLVPRQAISDVEVSGYRIPKGSQVLINAWQIGRDGKIWPEPESFKPERFLGSKIDFRGLDYELIPFGAGRRICPGMLLADRLLHLMVASMVHSFAWELPDKMDGKDLDMHDHYEIVLGKVVPLVAVPVRINRP